MKTTKYQIAILSATIIFFLSLTFMPSKILGAEALIEKGLNYLLNKNSTILKSEDNFLILKNNDNPPASVLNQPSKLFRVPRSNNFPKIDGSINFKEWQGAANYTLQTNQGNSISLRIKSVVLSNVSQNSTPLSPQPRLCSPYPTNPDYKIPCGKYLAMGLKSSALDAIDLFMDEGDDGYRGSGTRDFYLGRAQEDWKNLRYGNYFWSTYCYNYIGLDENCPGPVCTPWNQKDCWKCALNHPGGASGNYCYYSENPNQTAPPVSGYVQGILDGFHDRYPYCGGTAPECWIAIGPALPEARAAINFIGFVKEGNEEMELLIPLRGREIDNHSACGSNGYCDLSDLNVDYSNIVGISFFTNIGRCPANADYWDAHTFAQFILD